MSNDRCFVISPISTHDSEIREHVDDVFDFIIKPAALECGVEAYRADHLQEHGRITDQMFKSILNENFCIALLTGHNPNVFYELAIAQSVGKPVVILIEKGADLPFDVQDIRCVQYDLKPRALHNGSYKSELVAHIRGIQSQGWIVEPLLARYGVYGGMLQAGLSVNMASKTDFDVHCSGEISYLSQIQPDGTLDPPPEHKKVWKTSVHKGRLRAFGGNVSFDFVADIIESEEGMTSCFHVLARGSLDGNTAFLTYRSKEAVGGKNRTWTGVMILRIPSGGVISGMWMTTGFFDAPYFSLGTIRLDREAV